MDRARRFLLALAGAFAASLALQGEVSAYSVIEQKALGYDVLKCYVSQSDEGVFIVNGEVPLKSFTGYKTVINDNSPAGFAALPDAMPSLHTVGKSELNCRQLFGGVTSLVDGLRWIGMDIDSSIGGSFSGLLQNAGVESGEPVGERAKKELLSELGYELLDAQDTSGTKCFSFNLYYTLPGSTDKHSLETTRMCSPDGRIDSLEYDVDEHLLYKALTYELSTSDAMLIVKMLGNDNPNIAWAEYRIPLDDIQSFDDLREKIKEAVIDHYSSGRLVDNGLMATAKRTIYVDLRNPVNNMSSEGSPNAVYNLGNRTEAAIRVMNNLLGTGYSQSSDLQFSPDEQYNLYEHYLRNVYGINENNVLCEGDYSDEGALTSAGWIKAPYYVGGEIKACYMIPVTNVDKKVHALNVNRYFDGTMKGWNELLEDLNNIKDLLTVGGISDTEPKPDDGGENGTSVCYDGSGPLGWAICPIIAGATGIGMWMWDWIENDFLKFPSQSIFGDRRGVETSWGVLRNIANLVFIVIFLVIIFSQLTGVGIDNYGIKRILPKIIVTAILINLSFVICKIFIDISNIVGTSINSLLSKNMTAGLGSNGADFSIGMILAGTAADLGLVGAGVGLFSIVNPLLGFATGTMVITIGLSVLGIVVTLVLSLIFLYFILVVRQAGIILCIVLSPVAIACRMLPNTEKMYKRWFDIFKVLLVLYPICGAMVGAGQLAGAVLSTVPGEGMSLAAMIVQVVPFFFIPTLTRNSMAGLGNIGAKISGIGRNLGGKASGGLRGLFDNSERVKQYKQRRTEENGLSYARRVAERLNARKTSGLTLNDRQHRKLLEATRLLNANDAKVAEAKAGAVRVGQDQAYQRALSGVLGQELKLATDEFDGLGDGEVIGKARGFKGWFNPENNSSQAQMAALMNELVKRGKENELYTMLKDDGDGRIAQSEYVMRNLAESREAVASAYGKFGRKGKIKSFKEFMMGEQDGQALSEGTMRQFAEKSAPQYASTFSSDSMEQILEYQKNGNVILSGEQIVNAGAAGMKGSAAKKLEGVVTNNAQLLKDHISANSQLRFGVDFMREAIKDQDTRAVIERNAKEIFKSKELSASLTQTQREFYEREFHLGAQGQTSGTVPDE